MMKSKRIEKYGQDVAEAYRIIASYRLDESFLCSNCNGESFFEGKFPYSRRCLKCKKDTSPTAGTIFHGVRFPLHIALYIVKQLVESYSKPTSQKLVEDIFLQFNHTIRDKTVWAFIIKIFEAMKMPEFEFSSFRLFTLYNVGNKRILFVCGYYKGNQTYYSLVEDKDRDKGIQSFLKRYKSELSNFSIDNDNGHNHVEGFGPNHYQSYMNYHCYKLNFNFRDNKYDALMKLLTTQVSGSIFTLLFLLCHFGL